MAPPCEVAHDFRATISPLVYGYTANTSGVGDNIVLAVLVAGFAVSSDDAKIAAKQNGARRRARPRIGLVPGLCTAG